MSSFNKGTYKKINLSLYHRSKNEGVIKMEQVTLAKRFDLNQNKDLDFF